MSHVVVVASSPGAVADVLAAFRARGSAAHEVVGPLSALLQAVATCRPLAVLVDPDAVGRCMRSLTALIQAAAPSPVLLLLPPGGEAFFIDALAAGVAGGVLRGSTDVAPRAVDLALDGEVVIPRCVFPDLVRSLRGPAALSNPSGPMHRLTDRERAVLLLLSRGWTTAQIAEHLVVEPVTVRSHVAGILRKLRVKSREEAIDLLRLEGDGRELDLRSVEASVETSQRHPDDEIPRLAGVGPTVTKARTPQEARDYAVRVGRTSPVRRRGRGTPSL